MAKKLCDLKKTLRNDLESYWELVADPRHACMSCGRVANCKKRVCKPVRLPNKSQAKEMAAVG